MAVSNKQFLIGGIIIPLVVAVIGIVNFSKLPNWCELTSCHGGVTVKIAYKSDDAKTASILESELQGYGVTVEVEVRKDPSPAIDSILRWYTVNDEAKAKEINSILNAVLVEHKINDRILSRDHTARGLSERKGKLHLYL